MQSSYYIPLENRWSEFPFHADSIIEMYCNRNIWDIFVSKPGKISPEDACLAYNVLHQSSQMVELQ